MVSSFSKYQGLGNDFILMQVESESLVDPRRAQRLCDRHFGVGADGVLLVSPSEHADAKLTILNADGSRPEMCGNGLRCVALHLSRSSAGRSKTLTVETDAGVLPCELGERDGQLWVTLSLGKARIVGELSVRDQRFTRVSIGNPHAVLFGHDYGLRAIDEFAPEVSAGIEGGANVEFVRLQEDGSVDVIVWERGVGRTLACGTGAGAVARAAVHHELATYDAPVRVHLPGGMLEVRVQRADDNVILSGPAEHVFDGQTSL